MRLRKFVRASLRRGTIFDPAIQPLLDGDARALSRHLREEEVFDRVAHPSVLVSLSFHALNYLDLRILLILRSMHGSGARVTLLLRDHRVGVGEPGRLPPQEGRARLLDVLELLGVPAGSIQVANWSDVGSRLMNDPDFHRFLGAVDVAALGSALSEADVHFADFGDVLTTLSDVYLASRDKDLRSAWLLGGPSRYEVHRRGADAYLRTFGAEAARSIPLPPLPFLSDLPGIVPESVQRSAISEACSSMERSELLMLHEAFLALLEDALGEPLHARARVNSIADLKKIELCAVTADAFVESLGKLQARARKRRPADVFTVPPARTFDCLAALGDERRARIMEAILRSADGLEVTEVMATLGLPREQLSSVRRDLQRLKDVGLVLTRGIKPQRWVATAHRLEIELPRP